MAKFTKLKGLAKIHKLDQQVKRLNLQTAEQQGQYYDWLDGLSYVLGANGIDFSDIQYDAAAERFAIQFIGEGMIGGVSVSVQYTLDLFPEENLSHQIARMRIEQDRVNKILEQGINKA